MRVLLADGDPDVRGALRLLLTHDLGMQVVGEASDTGALRMQAQDTAPDLLLLDWALADASAVVADLRTRYPTLRIVVLSAHPEARSQALTGGADAFVSKADAPTQLVTTLRALRAAAQHGRIGS
jgi:DNA-binding NarL/FixJ family response regulator